MEKEAEEIMTKPEIIMKMRELKVPFYDLHTHSINKYTNAYEGGTVQPSQQVITAAEELGLKYFAITDHSYEIVRYADLPENTVLNEKFNSFEPYIKYLDNIKNKIKVPLLKGVELYIDKSEHAHKINKKTLNALDFVLLETRTKLNFSEIRSILGNNITLFLAHPTVESFFDENTEINEIANWLDSLKENKIYFEINRSNFKQYLERPKFYKKVFDLALEKGIKFTIGSDFHQIPGNYLKFYTKLCQIVELYKLRNFYEPNGQK